MKTFHIVVLPGDGIGPEVTDATLKVLRALETSGSGGADFELALDTRDAGAGLYQRVGESLPESVFDACRAADAVLLGAMGLPDVRYPNGKEIAPQLDLRERLGLYGGVRPIHLYNEADTPLKGHAAGDIDFVIVRESTEGIFAGRGEVADLNADSSTSTIRVTRQGCRRVCKIAFEIARQRAAADPNAMKKVSLIDKANVLSPMVYLRHHFDEIAAEYPDITAEHVYVDAAALFMVRDPTRFDVAVTENMFGDILSDLAAGLVGGMGMAPSGDIGDSAAVFQPSHGSAPDIAGRGVANPIAMILSAAMMLDWLGRDDSPASGRCRRGAAAIRGAVRTTLADPARRTADMGGTMSTDDMASAVADRTAEIFEQSLGAGRGDGR